MNVSELVGFLITILVLLIALMRKLREEKFRREHPEEYAEKKRQEEESVKAFLRSLDLAVDDEEPVEAPRRRRPPPPPPEQGQYHTQAGNTSVSEGFEFHSKLDDFKLRSRVAQRQYKSEIEKLTGRSLLSEKLRKNSSSDVYMPREIPKNSRSRDFLKGLPNRQTLFLAHEIFGPPKGLQSD